MAYSDDILALSPDHRWALDGDALDASGTADGTNSGGVFTGTPVCRDAVNSYVTNGTTDRIVLPTTADINNSTQTRKAIGGWFSPTAIQNPPKSIYGEGNSSQSIRMILGWGNNLMFELNYPGLNIQIFGDVPLVANRRYHLCMVFEGNGYGNEFRAYLDGVKQLNANPVDRQPNVASIASRGVGEFGDPAGTVGVGGIAIILLAPINGQYNQWASWNGAPALLTDTQIRQELFEKGTIPEVTITNQADLDALANTVRSNTELSILVNVPGSIALTADNVTFDPLASIHVQYNGTGTLDWTNTNGSNASIVSTTNGGTVNVINPTSLTLNSGITGYLTGAEVRIYDNENLTNSNYDTELSGIESNATDSYVFDHNGATNDIVIQIMKTGYEELIVNHSLTSVSESITLYPTVEENE